MKPAKAYILKINDALSEEYAKTCADSCDKVGLKWEYFQGYQNMTGRDAWDQTGIPMKFDRTRWPKREPVYIANPPAGEKAECCSAGHGSIWKKIAEGEDEAAIILEHDALMLQPVDIDIPDYCIVVLGYKVGRPEMYDHLSAGPPKELIAINGHEGAHAYAMTKKTAQFLIQEITEKGLLGCIDNAYFIRGQRRTAIPLAMASPTPAIGWLRKSTIWDASAHRNYEFIESFKQNYK